MMPKRASGATAVMAIAGEQVHVLMQPKDQYGNQCLLGGEEVTCEFLGPQHVVLPLARPPAGEVAFVLQGFQVAGVYTGRLVDSQRDTGRPTEGRAGGQTAPPVRKHGDSRWPASAEG